MARILLISLFSVMFSYGLYAQQDPTYDQYMYNQMAINPAYAGITDLVCLGADVRNMFTGIEGGPNTRAFNASAPIKPFGLPSGVGISILRDEAGFNKNTAMNLAYSYKLNIRNGKLGIGAGFGFINMAYDNVNWRSPQGGSGSEDAFIPTGGHDLGFDLNLGTYYKTDNLYMGFSVNHLLASRLEFDNALYKFKPNYNLLAGYRMQLSNPAFEIQPSVYLISEGAASGVTLNTNLEYNKKIWGGLGYRVGESLIALLGMELFEGVRVCASYDFITTDLRESAQPSYEFSLSYCFNLKVDKTPQRYKSVRFL